MRCWICGTTEQSDFSTYRNNFICDGCMSVINYHFNEAVKELQDDHGTPMSELLEAFAEYASYKQDEYNEQLRKERMNQWQK